MGVLCVRRVGGPSGLLCRTSSLVHGNYRVTTVGTNDASINGHTTSSRAKTVTGSSSTIRTLFHGTNVIHYFDHRRLAAITDVFALGRIGNGGYTVVARTKNPTMVLTSTLRGKQLGIPGLSNPLTTRLGSGLCPKTTINGPVSVVNANAPRRLTATVSFYRGYFRSVSLVVIVFNDPNLMGLCSACRILRGGVRRYGGPVFPMLPSVMATNPRIGDFIGGNRIGFSSRIALNATLSHILGAPGPVDASVRLCNISIPRIHHVVSQLPNDNCLGPRRIHALLGTTRVPLMRRFASASHSRLITFTGEIGFPIMTGMINPVRGDSVKNITLGVQDRRRLVFRCRQVVHLPSIATIVMRPVLGKRRLFLKTGCRSQFNRIILYNLKNVFIRILGSISCNLSPLSCSRACSVVHSLHNCPVVGKAHNRQKISRRRCTSVVIHLSALLHFTSRVGRVSVGPLITARQKLFTMSTHVQVRG